MDTPMSVPLKGQPITIDPHYSPKFYAELWGVSESSIVRWFRDEPGVLKGGNPGKSGSRTRVELRIPLSVALRIYAERTK